MLFGGIQAGYFSKAKKTYIRPSRKRGFLEADSLKPTGFWRLKKFSKREAQTVRDALDGKQPKEFGNTLIVPRGTIRVSKAGVTITSKKYAIRYPVMNPLALMRDPKKTLRRAFGRMKRGEYLILTHHGRRIRVSGERDLGAMALLIEHLREADSSGFDWSEVRVEGYKPLRQKKTNVKAIARRHRL